MILRRSCTLLLLVIFLRTSGQLFAAEQSRGWGSSWTVPHSAEEKQSRDLDDQVRKALNAQDWSRVAKLLEDGRKLNPDSLPLVYASAVVAMKRQHYDEAASAFTRMLSLPTARRSPRITSEIYTERAYMKALQGSYQSSRADLEHAIASDKTNAHAHNNYAWLLATCPQGDVRDGQRALSFARAINQKTNSSSAMMLDTLAAAQAEAGDLPGAIKTQQRAIAAARHNNPATYQRHLKSYQQGQPVHEAPEPPTININPQF